MTSSTESIRELFDEIDRTPWGPHERDLVARAVSLAQDSGDARLEYEARLRQTSSANMNGDTDLMLTSFAWCLAQHDADPERFPAEIESAGDLLWHYKWMAGALRGSPEFSSAQIDAVLDDMEQHYQRAGAGPSGALMARFEDAWSAGRIAEATVLRERIEATPRDDYSHCDACVRSQFAGFSAETGREDDAIRLVEEMVEGGFSCGEEPERALGRVLLPLLHAGQHDEARTAHLRSYRLARDNADNLPIIADNVVFCAITGNEARALALVEKHLRWLAHDGLNADGHREALAAFAVALDAVTRAGHGDTAVRGSNAAELTPLLGAHDGPWTAAELAARCWSLADGIAAAFDRRNGTDAHAQRLERVRAIGAERYDVPLSTEEFAPRSAAAQPLSTAERVVRARALGSMGAPAAVAAIQDALPDVAAEDMPELTFLLLRGFMAEGRAEEAAPALAVRAEALRALGHHARAELELSLGAELFGLDDEFAGRALAAHPDAPVGVRAHLLSLVAFGHLRAERVNEATATLELARALHAEAGETFRLHAMRQFEADVHLTAGDVDGAAAVLDALLADVELEDGRRARVLLDRAMLRERQNDPARGIDDADEGVRLLMAHGADAPLIASALTLSAQLAERAGRADRAVVAYRLAMRELDAAGEPSTGLRYGLGRALIAVDAPQEAVEVLEDLLQFEVDADEAPGSRALTAGLLARAFENSGEWGMALRAWQLTADLHAEADEPARRASALVALGQLWSRLDETDEAVEVFEAAVAAARADEEGRAMLAEALHSYAQALDRRGDEEAFTALDEALEIGRADEAEWFVADVTDTRARMLAGRGRTDEAVAHALQAADGFLGFGVAPSAAGSELLAARVLIGAGRAEEAVAVLRSALDHAEGEEQLRQAVAIDLGTALEALGRHGEAAEIRRTLPA